MPITYALLMIGFIILIYASGIYSRRREDKIVGLCEILKKELKKNTVINVRYVHRTRPHKRV